MEDIARILDMVSSFVSGMLSWSVVALIIAVIFKEVIKGRIQHLTCAKLPGGVELGFAAFTDKLDHLITSKEENKNQITLNSTGKFEESNNPETAIPRIYSRIEAALREKFNLHDHSSILISLFDAKKIDTDTFIILDSMRSLKDNIQLFTTSQKITRKDIDAYESNANRMIKIIQAIES